MASWPIKVALQEDESLSSWLSRAALENGCDPLVLTGSIWPKWRVWTTDIDRGIPISKQSALILASGLDASLFQQAALSLDAELFSSCSLPVHGLWPWILGLGARNRSYKGGIQFCPCCFADDLKPYFRRHWRFAWVTGCSLHGVRLIDSCSQCRKPIEPHRLEAINAVELSACSSCGFDLRHAVAMRALPCALSLQEKAFTAINNGIVEINDELWLPEQWFDACRHLMMIIRRSAYVHDSAMTRALIGTGLNIQEIPTESLAFKLELLPVEAREKLLACFDSLLSNWERFALNLKLYGVQANSLMGREDYLPPILASLISPLERVDRRLGQPRKTTCGKPKSKESVLKAWARLKRKHRVE